MKTKKEVYKYLLIIVLLIAIIPVNAQKSSGETIKLEKVIDVDPDMTLDFICQEGNVTLNTWNKNQVKITGELTLSTKDKEDEETIKSTFKNVEVTKGAKIVEVNTDFYISKSWIVGIPLTLLNGKTRISIDDFKVSYTIWIPEKLGFKYSSKYNKLVAGNLKGEVNINMYNGELHMGEIGSDFTIELKYSKAFLGNGGSGSFLLYDSDIETGDMKDVRMESKYSEIHVQNLKSLDISSYDDDIFTKNVDKLKATSKYSKFVISGDMNSAKLDLYDSNVDAKNIDNLTVDGKYSKYNGSRIQELSSSFSYENKFDFQSVGKLSFLESKYDDFFIDTVFKSMMFTQAYTTDISVKSTPADFNSCDGNFKYGNILLAIDEKLDFHISINAQYGDITIPDSKLPVKESIKDGSEYKLIGYTKENASCKFKLESYSTDIIIK